MRVKIRHISIAAFVLIILALLSTGGVHAGGTDSRAQANAFAATKTRTPTATPEDDVTPEETESVDDATETPGGDDFQIDGGDSASETPTATKKVAKKTVTPTPNAAVIEGGELTLDEPATGTIDKKHTLYAYSYQGTENEPLHFTLEAEGGLTALLAIAAPKGVKWSDAKPLQSLQAKSGASNELDLELPGDGTYSLFVTYVGTPKGSFTLTLSAGDDATTTKETATPTPNAAVIDGGVLTLDEPTTGVIDKTHTLYFYSYEGTENDPLHVTLEAQKGLTALLAIGTPKGAKWQDGKILQSLQAKSGATNELDLELPADGKYSFIVTYVGTAKGSFTLTLSAGSDATATNSDAVQEIDITGNSRSVVSGMQEAGIIPEGGKQVLIVPNSFGKTQDPNLSFLVLGRGLQVQDFVLNFDVSWRQAGDKSGCGFLFRDTSSNNLSIVLLTNDGQVDLFQNENRKTVMNYANSSDLFTPGETTTVTLAAVGDQISLYINGKLETVETTQGTAVPGGFAIAVYNDKDNTVLTDCRYKNIWVWSLD